MSVVSFLWLFVFISLGTLFYALSIKLQAWFAVNHPRHSPENTSNNSNLSTRHLGNLSLFFFLARAALVQHGTQFPATTRHKLWVFPLLSHKKYKQTLLMSVCVLHMESPPLVTLVITPIECTLPFKYTGKSRQFTLAATSLSKSSRPHLMARVHLWASFLLAAPKVAPLLINLIHLINFMAACI